MSRERSLSEELKVIRMRISQFKSCTEESRSEFICLECCIQEAKQWRTQRKGEEVVLDLRDGVVVVAREQKRLYRHHEENMNNLVGDLIRVKRKKAEEQWNYVGERRKEGIVLINTSTVVVDNQIIVPKSDGKREKRENGLGASSL